MEVVVYEPQSNTTHSQVERVQKAIEGDLTARLDLIKSSDVESTLSGIFRDGHSNLSILSYLQSPGEGKTQADAVKDVLEELADSTEQVAYATALVWKYARDHRVWESHVNPLMRSEETFLQNLDHRELVQINLVVGTSTDAVRRNSIRIIDATWGQGWFERIPVSIRPPVFNAACTPKRLLWQLAALCKSGRALEDVVEQMQDAVRNRLDPALRRRTKCTVPLTPHLISCDVATLTKTRSDKEQGRRTLESFFPEMHEDRLELQPLKQAKNPELPILQPKKRRAPAGGGPKEPRRRRAKRSDANEGSDNENRAELGQHEEERESEGDGLSMSQASSSTWECDGPALQLVLSKFGTILDEFDMQKRVCDTCYPAANEALARVRGLQIAIDKLAAVQEHMFGELPASSLPLHNISPEKAALPRRRQTVTIEDSSDDD